MGLREIESTLPPGFRFYPSDEELVCHYLYKKVANERAAQGTLVEVDLHAREPWELPDAAKLTASEWYFFSFRDRKYATGSRTNRATKTGYWKATGKDREVRSPAAARAIVGMRKTLVFYQGRAPNGVKSCWVMHEFRLDSPHTPPKVTARQAVVLASGGLGALQGVPETEGRRAGQRRRLILADLRRLIVAGGGGYAG
ncbi:hypothetical protein PAHAL_7G220000 [Panicum hallii]|uniref:NAC domain-containing protein n=1 Tax=Panicum hallii TaxID=206008 RepID=A0A2T8ID30_9POAL|nr:hypothetical protein PAHAL_7G220000 [Panicum hallii]